jgi:nicotinate phosphoribosyltransferase
MTSTLSGLDYYKLTMSQQAWRVAPDAQVTFTLRNRSPEQRLIERISVEQLNEALAEFKGFRDEDVRYLDTLGIFDVQYLRYLVWSLNFPVPKVSVRDGDLHVEVTGAWPLVTFWETVVLSTVNDLYFKSEAAYRRTDGHMNLSAAINELRKHPGIKISDFGTRRRFGLDWQAIVVARMAAELPEQFVGTSNPYLAQQYGLKPIGTFAHEMPMVYAARWDGIGDFVKQSHDLMLDDWYQTYGEDLSIALTDTWGTDFFFKTFGADRARQWKGLRHDSGDPFEFGQRAIDFYYGHGIDPATKTLVFSDGLDLKKILALYDRFRGSVNLSFGWGTGLTNNVGVRPLNIVMKATCVNGIGTVKLSDDAGKHTGSPADIARYLKAKEPWL